jgi:hypothetical protein
MNLDFMAVQRHKYDTLHGGMLKGEMNMGIERVTAYPSRYGNEVSEDLLVASSAQARTFYVDFDVVSVRVKRNMPTLGTKVQRELATLIGSITGERPEYRRLERFYVVGDWTVRGGSIVSEEFDAECMQQTLLVLVALGEAGWRPDGEIHIHFRPEMYDRRMVLNVLNIMKARSRLITQALALADEIKIIIDREMVFGVPLNAFSFEVIEACIILLRQASLKACSIGKARMQPCDETNPKYQMRTWLLRLGFIGDAFSRPRQTLLNNLPGDGAFFGEMSKEKAAAKRKVQSAARR